MKEHLMNGETIIKDFDHSAYRVVFKKGDGSGDTSETVILSRNVSTLIKVIDKFKVHGQCSNYIKSITEICNCSDVYVGDLFKY